MSRITDYPNAVNDMPLVMPIGDQKVETYSHHCVLQRKEVVTVNPSTNVAGNLLANQTLEFRFDDQATRISHVELRVSWENGSGSPCVVTQPEAMISQIQIYSDNASTLLYQSFNNLENYLINNVQESYTEHLNSAITRGTNATYDRTPVTLPPGSAGVWYLPIAPQFWRSVHLRPYAIQGNIIIKLYFNTATANIVSGTLTTPAAVLRVTHYRESETQKAMIRSRVMVPKRFWYLAPQRHIETVTLSGLQSTKIRLQGIKGDVVFAMIAIRPTAALNNATTQFNSFVLLQEYEFLNAEDQSICGYNPVVRDEAQIMYGRAIQNVFIPTIGCVFHSFSQSPHSDLLRGTIGGYERFSGFHSIRITPVFGTASGSYEVFVLALCSETLRVDNGKVSSTRA